MAKHNFTYDRPTAEQLRAELEREEQKERKKASLMIKLGIAASAVFIALILLFCLFPVLKIHGGSMSPAVSDGSYAVVLRGPFYKGGDIIAYAYGNKSVSSRIIGLPGDTVDIDRDGNVYVNGEVISEEYVSEKTFGVCDIDLPCTVPEGRYFVLGDDRTKAEDSRSMKIGCIDESQIVGKVLFTIG
ncbi:MAG: signal peptidase I [Clostridia bacterium]|nr:signal peptidase I [Clostridia bacterium]